MTERNPPDDLDAYLPDKETAEAVMKGDVEYNREVNPALRARLAELNRLSSNPDLGRPAPPSVAVYAETTLTGDATPDETTLPPKVQVKVPLREESPTQPSLRRLEGEPELLGVVKARREARAPAPPGASQRFSLRSVALALLAVLVPVFLVIFLMGRTTRQVERDRATSAATATVLAAMPSAVPSASEAASPKTTPSAASVPSVEPSASPTGSASAPVHAPTGTRPQHSSHGAPDDPYDPPPATVSPAVTAAPQVTGALSAAAPPVAPPPVAPPPAAPTTTGFNAPAPKPEF